MKLTYLGLKSDLKEILPEEFNKNKEVLYVFENTSSFFEIKREYLQTFQNIFNNFKLMNSYDFYEKLFETDKIVIKEEKQAVLFYNSLDKSIKRELKIKNYYDAIDIAYNFYTLFSELQEYKVDYSNKEELGLEKWQEKTFDELVKINKNIEKKVQEKGLILPYMLRRKENISDVFIKKYKKICFINKIKFTPFEEEIIEILESKGIEVENKIQLGKNDFDEEKLQIKDSFSLPEKEEFERDFGVNIEIHEYENKFTQLLGMIKKLSSGDISGEDVKECKIYDLQGSIENNESDYHLLNQSKIKYNLEITMQKTKIYKVLELLYNILENVRPVHLKNGDVHYMFKVKEFYNAYKSDNFLNTFGLERTYSYFQSFAREDYKYISKEQLSNFVKESEEEKRFLYEDEVKVLTEFIGELERILNFSTLKDFEDYLSELFNKNDIEGSNVRDKYFEALSEMTVLEEFEFDDLWEGFFGKNISASLLKLFLKYLDKKAISIDLEKISEEDVEQYSINDFSSISETSKKNLIFLNLQDTFPEVKVNNFFFSKIQREKIGLPVSEEEKKVENFKLINNILNAENVYLSYIKNIDESKDCSGIIEEIRLKYGKEVIKNEILEKDELEFVKRYFTEDKWEKRKIGKFIKSKLKKDLERLRDAKLNLGYYSFEKIEKFEYGYYLENMIGKTEIEEIDEKINPLMFGSIIHSVYEKIVKENKEKIEKFEYDPDINEIKKILNEVLSSYEYKMPQEFIKFYREISFEEIAKSIKKFFRQLKEEMLNQSEIEIYSEEKVRLDKEKNIYKNVYINGRMDLYIKTAMEKIFVDYKSGKLDKKEKIEEAQRQLDYYSIMLEENDGKEIKKWIVDTWNGEIIKDERDTSPLTEDDIKNVLKRYYENEYYSIGEGEKEPKTFNYRTYKNICRWKDEVNGENE